MTKRIAYLGIPHTGGTFSAFLALRRALAPYGSEVRWVGVGRRSFEAASQPQFNAFATMGEVAGRDATTLHGQLLALKGHLESDAYETVLVNAGCGLVETNIARYLAPSLHRLQIVHTITPGAYEYARIIEPWTHGTVCVSPRASRDLIERFGFPAAKVFTVPSAIDLEALAGQAATGAGAAERDPEGDFRILFLGRIEKAAKGVLLLPRIAREIGDLPFRLTVAGDGPDLPELKRRFAGLEQHVVFTGEVARSNVGALYATHDAFLFPSHYEGLGMALLEAMASGCVPVASRIAGVTDSVVDDGVNGFLFPIGDAKAAARALTMLCHDAPLRAAFAARGRDKVRDTFSLERMAAGYIEALSRTQGQALARPVDAATWDFPERLSSRLRQRLPAGLKDTLRRYREIVRARAALRAQRADAHAGSGHV